MRRINAATERVFSIVNNMWTEEKCNMKIDTVKACIITRCNINLPCDKIINLIGENESFLKKVHSIEKYN